MAYSQDYVNQLVREAAAQAGGTLSYADVSNAAANLGIPASQINAAMSTGVIAAPAVQDIVAQLSPGQAQNIGGVVYQPVYEQSSLQGIDAPESTPLKEVLVYNQNQQTGDAYKQYTPTGEYIKAGQFKDVGNFGDLLKDAYKAVGPIGMMALTAGGAGSLLGGSLGLTGTAANVAGSALLGGGNAALTGGDVLKGAVLGGAGGYLSSALASGVTDADYLQAAMDADIAGGMVPEFGTNAAYDAFMQSAMTPEAMSAIEQMIANSSVAGMTPEQILAQGNVITDMASGNYMGPMTADELGNSFEKYMAEAGYLPTKVVETGTPKRTPTVVGGGGGGGGGSVLTPGNLLNVAKVAAIVGGVTNVPTSVTPQNGGFDIVPVPTDWRAPTNTQAPYKPLPPIDFGSRELLRGTQWEKYLNPVQPAAVQPVQMGMGYNQLMNTLQGGQGGNLTLNDIISGIQGQYGQTPSGTVG